MNVVWLWLMLAAGGILLWATLQYLPKITFMERWMRDNDRGPGESNGHYWNRAQAAWRPKSERDLK